MRSAFAPFAKKIGMQKAKIFLDWPQIVGQEIANLCKVEKVFSLTNSRQIKIYLTASFSASVTLHYLIPHMMERITMFFGYDACSEIVIQSNKNSRKAAFSSKKISHVCVVPNDYCVEGIEDITNENLKNALRSLSFVIEQSEQKNT